VLGLGRGLGGASAVGASRSSKVHLLCEIKRNNPPVQYNLDQESAILLLISQCRAWLCLGLVLASAVLRVRLRAFYAMSGTDVAYRGSTPYATSYALSSTGIRFS